MVYRGARRNVSNKGRVVDWESLRRQGAKTVALGNARMNARGDVIGQGGKILKTAEEREREFQAAQDSAGGPPQTQQTSIKRDAIPGRNRQDTQAFNSAQEAKQEAVKRNPDTRGMATTGPMEESTETVTPEEVVAKEKEKQKARQESRKGQSKTSSRKSTRNITDSEE